MTIRMDVAVVGAGIVGCAIARSVARDGHSVVVLDPDPPGQHASWAAAGMLAPQAETDSPDPLLPLLLQARDRYREYIRELESETDVDVGYSDAGMLFLALDEHAHERVIERVRWQSEAGLPIELLAGGQVRALEPAITPDVVSAINFRGDHSVDNRLLTQALYSSAEAAGARFHFEAAERLSFRDGCCTILTSAREEITATRVVVAAGSWSGNIAGLPRRLPVEPVHGELISYSAPGLLGRTIGVEGGYLVPRTDGRIIVGTTVNRIGFSAAPTQTGLMAVKKIAERVVPELSRIQVTDHWAGLRPGTPDGLPVLGQDPDVPSLLYATGHYRNGILLAPLTGEIIAGLIAGRPEIADISEFRPDRFEE
jgi:glycine oxidase